MNAALISHKYLMAPEFEKVKTRSLVGFVEVSARLLRERGETVENMEMRSEMTLKS
ncbi:hypothetical protein AB1L05_14695 [Cytobacillus horneckiae]